MSEMAASRDARRSKRASVSQLQQHHKTLTRSPNSLVSLSLASLFSYRLLSFFPTSFPGAFLFMYTVQFVASFPHKKGFDATRIDVPSSISVVYFSSTSI